MRRMGRPGLVGTMARTAVIAGTATAVSGSMQQKSAANAQQAQQAQAFQQEQAAAAQQASVDAAVAQALAVQAAQQAAAAPAAPVPVAAPAAPAVDVVAELTKLGELKAAGILDDAEFAAAKAKILG